MAGMKYRECECVLEAEAARQRSDVSWHAPCYISFFLKVNGLIKKAVTPPSTTPCGELTQVTLWQGCEPVKVKMNHIIQTEFPHYNTLLCLVTHRHAFTHPYPSFCVIWLWFCDVFRSLGWPSGKHELQGLCASQHTHSWATWPGDGYRTLEMFIPAVAPECTCSTFTKSHTSQPPAASPSPTTLHLLQSPRRSTEAFHKLQLFAPLFTAPQVNITVNWYIY